MVIINFIGIISKRNVSLSSENSYYECVLCDINTGLDYNLYIQNNFTFVLQIIATKEKKNRITQTCETMYVIFLLLFE